MTLDGVTFLDHTADIGMDVVARSLEELLHRAAVGMLVLLRGEEEADGPDGRGTADDPETQPEPTRVALESRGAALLLADWLREVLLLHEVHARDYVAFTPDAVAESRLSGVIWTRAGGAAVREIKGVTYHELVAERTDGGWRGRVIFDV